MRFKTKNAVGTNYCLFLLVFDFFIYISNDIYFLNKKSTNLILVDLPISKAL